MSDESWGTSLIFLVGLEIFLLFVAFLAVVSGSGWFAILPIGFGILVLIYRVREVAERDEQERIRQEQGQLRLQATRDARAKRELAERSDALFRAAGLDDIATMTHSEFTSWVGAVLRGAGYEVKMVKGKAAAAKNKGGGGTDEIKGDVGIDLIAINGGNRTAVLCKRQDKPVGAGAVQQAVTGAEQHGCVRAMVACSTAFTPAAGQLAEAHGCTLADRATLEKWCTIPKDAVGH